MTAVYERHALSAAWPSMTDPELKALTTDIALNGLRNAIALYEGRVLDGWNRFQACLAAGVEPETYEFKGDHDDAVRFVISQNGCRRNLTPIQIATAALMCTEWRHAGESHTANSKTVAEIAAAANVSPRTVERAKRIVKQGHGAAVLAGSMTPGEAEGALPRGGPQSAPEEPDELTQLRDKVAELSEELAILAPLALGQEHVIEEMRALRAQLSAATTTRDDYMQQCAEMKREIKKLRHKLGVPA